MGDKVCADVGRNRVMPEVRATLGSYPQLAKKAAQAMADANLVLVPEAGHVPHLGAPHRSNEELMR